MQASFDGEVHGDALACKRSGRDPRLQGPGASEVDWSPAGRLPRFYGRGEKGRIVLSEVVRGKRSNGPNISLRPLDV